METNQENIITNKDNANSRLFEKAIISGAEKSVIKIIREKKINNELKLISGTGFFCKIYSKNLQVLLTNNSILDQNFLDNEKKLKYIIEKNGKEDKKEINLTKDRYKYTNE